MKLAEWIAREGLPVKRVAALAGVSRPSVANVVAGLPLQTYELAERLVQLTGGEVTHADIADPTGEVRRRIAEEVVPYARARLRPDLERDQELRGAARIAIAALERVREALGEHELEALLQDERALAWAEVAPGEPDEGDEALRDGDAEPG